MLKIFFSQWLRSFVQSANFSFYYNHQIVDNRTLGFVI